MKIKAASFSDTRGPVELLRITGNGNRVEFQIACFERHVHRVVWDNGRVLLPDHTPDEHELQRAFRKLDGPPDPCFLLGEWLATGVYFEP